MCILMYIKCTSESIFILTTLRTLVRYISNVHYKARWQYQSMHLLYTLSMYISMYFYNVHYQCTSKVLQKKCSFNLHFNVLCIHYIISHILYIGNVHCKCAFQCTSHAHLSIYSYLLYYAHSQGTLPMYINMLF